MASEILELFKQSQRPTAKHDTYYPVYDEMFAPYKGRDITFVEVGIAGGGSLEAWKKYFGKNSRIIGIDLNPALQELLRKDGYEVFIGDQADPAFWRDFYASVGKIDILLDDGGHTNTQTWTTIKHSINHINDGGLIVIEDTHAAYKRSFGNPSKNSLVEKLTACIDEINYRSSAIDQIDRKSRRRDHVVETLRDIDIAGKLYSIRVYESIIALSIDSRKCVRSAAMKFGSVESLPGGSHPEDYRHKGIREKLKARVTSRIRSLLHRVL